MQQTAQQLGFFDREGHIRQAVIDSEADREIRIAGPEVFAVAGAVADHIGEGNAVAGNRDTAFFFAAA